MKSEIAAPSWRALISLGEPGSADSRRARRNTAGNGSNGSATWAASGHPGPPPSRPLWLRL